MAAKGATVKVKYNPQVTREVANLRETGDALATRAEDIVQGARTTYAPHRRTGAYVESLYATKEHGGRGWAGQAVADVPYAWFVEYGTEEQTVPVAAPMRQAAEALGKVRGR